MMGEGVQGDGGRSHFPLRINAEPEGQSSDRSHRASDAACWAAIFYRGRVGMWRNNKLNPVEVQPKK